MKPPQIAIQFYFGTEDFENIQIELDFRHTFLEGTLDEVKLIATTYVKEVSSLSSIGWHPTNVCEVGTMRTNKASIESDLDRLHLFGYQELLYNFMLEELGFPENIYNVVMTKASWKLNYTDRPIVNPMVLAGFLQNMRSHIISSIMNIYDRRDVPTGSTSISDLRASSGRMTSKLSHFDLGTRPIIKITDEAARDMAEARGIMERITAGHTHSHDALTSTMESIMRGYSTDHAKEIDRKITDMHVKALPAEKEAKSWIGKLFGKK